MIGDVTGDLTGEESQPGRKPTPEQAPQSPGRRRALLIANAKGTRGRSACRHALAPVIERLRAGGIEADEPLLPEDPARIPALIADLARAADLVILGGGDGTFSRAADALLASGRPVGLLPMGNANDLARTLAIPVDLQAAAGIIAEGHTRPVDLGWLNGRHFFNVASMGLSVRIARRLTRERKLRWGVLAYLACARESLHRQRSFRARITVNQQAYEIRTMQVAVGNGRHYGGGMTVVEDAAIDDGRLDLYALPRLRCWQLLVLLPVLRWGWHRPVGHILSLHGSEITVETDRRLRLNVDGEVDGWTPAHFRVIPKALSVFSPRPRAVL